jgi:asparagine synthase (glutamine-hydrolysing)
MCGILGVVNQDIEEKILKNAVSTLKHRGPDEEGHYLDKKNKVSLGHARLSIIDLKTGLQPIFNEKKDLIIICNGEIYDFERIRSNLEKKGHKFSTKSDTEVILHLYEEYGMNFFKYLRGEFSFIIYDKRKNQILAVRDRFGIKPLFYNEKNNKFVLASELKAIFATFLVERKLNIEALRNNMCLVMTPDSYFEGIKAIPPGSYLLININKDYKIKKYWDLNLPKNINDKGFEKYEKDFVKKFDNAVKLRLRADVPVGVYLSGGIDSSAIAGTIAKYHNQKIKAFSIKFNDAKFDESKIAKRMAKKIGAEYLEVKADNETLLRNFEDCLWHSEIPASNLHGVAKFLLSNLARKHVKVVLTGEGGDELFLGYDYFKKDSNYTFANAYMGKTLGSFKQKELSTKIKKDLGFLPLNEMNFLFSEKGQRIINSVFNKKYRDKLNKTNPLDTLKNILPKEQLKDRKTILKKQYFSIKGILSPYILVYLGDRQEMAHSVEGRTPLLDHEVFEMTKNIPLKYKLNKKTEKYFFRKVMKKRVTYEVYKGHKWQFMAPPIKVTKWRSRAMNKLIRKYLSKKEIENAGIFDANYVKKIYWLQKLTFFNKKLNTLINTMLMFVLSVQILHNKFIENFEDRIKNNI